MGTQLPDEVREQPTSQTSIYRQGQLVYDGASGQTVGGASQPAPSGPPQGDTMSQLLQWGIQNSNPEELKRRAEAGEQKPLTALDKEMLDVLLGQPTVATMRALLLKLEPEALGQPNGEEEALAAVEELEFHCEDLDNANDLAKIGGLKTLLAVAAAEVDAELKEGALGVLAAGLQNNPPFQQAAAALGAPALLLQLLQPTAPLVVRRKALYALSALLRTGGDEAAAALQAEATVPTLLRAAGSDDAKQQRRALFLLLALLRESAGWAASVSLDGLAAHRELLGAALLGAARGEDVEARESALQLLLLLRADEPLRAQLAAAGAEAGGRSGPGPHMTAAAPEACVGRAAPAHT